MKVLSYGRKRAVIMEAIDHDRNCVLANILAAHFCCSSDPSRVPSLLHAANSNLVISHYPLLALCVFVHSIFYSVLHLVYKQVHV